MKNTASTSPAQPAAIASSADKPKLRIDWATHGAAKYACEKWHYSKCIPKSKLVKIGAWENDEFLGVVIFGVGATASLVTKYGLSMIQGCELVRVALKAHRTPVTRIVAIAIRFLVRSNPGLRLIVSFADPEKNHHGGIYQAGNWIYSGRTHPDRTYRIGSRMVHPRTISLMVKAGKITRAIAEQYRVPNDGKHRYLMPLDEEMRRQIQLLAKPYPKRAGSSAVAALSDQEREGGSIPTPALQG